MTGSASSACKIDESVAVGVQVDGAVGDDGELMLELILVLKVDVEVDLMLALTSALTLLEPRPHLGDKPVKIPSSLSSKRDCGPVRVEVDFELHSPFKFY